MHKQWVSSLIVCTSLAYSGVWAIAQQTESTTRGSQGQSRGEDLDELAKELDAAEEEEADDVAAQAKAAEEAMNSYAARARRQAVEARERLLKDPGWRPTHKQVHRIELPAPLQNICLDMQGQILAGCGDKVLRVLSQDGQTLENRQLSFVPQAICVRPSDGAIFVAGQGKLVRMSANGEIQQETDFPRPPTEEEREAILKQLLERAEDQLKQMEQLSKGIRAQLDAVHAEMAKDPVSDEEQQQAAKIPEPRLFSHVSGITMTKEGPSMRFADGTSRAIQVRALQAYLSQIGAIDIEQQRATLESQARRQAEMQTTQSNYTGVAVTEDDLFVICSGPGYSYNAWRMTHDFQQPKQILAGLRGCCGQLDCQTLDGNLWLAMNTQHKVICYDRDGNELSRFGKRDAEAADGFGGCCEPKNLRFSRDGKHIYCAQSGPPVCVKRFSLEGDFLDVVCFPVFETGCVRVSVDADGERFFMMSPNESTIYVFEPEQS